MYLLRSKLYCGRPVVIYFIVEQLNNLDRVKAETAVNSEVSACVTGSYMKCGCKLSLRQSLIS